MIYLQHIVTWLICQPQLPRCNTLMCCFFTLAYMLKSYLFPNKTSLDSQWSIRARKSSLISTERWYVITAFTNEYILTFQLKQKRQQVVWYSYSCLAFWYSSFVTCSLKLQTCQLLVNLKRIKCKKSSYKVFGLWIHYWRYFGQFDRF